MSDLIKIDKRNKSDGYCMIAGDGFVSLIQGGNGRKTNVIHLNDSELQAFIADLESAVTELSARHCKKVGL
jgi:hypothetical protein